MTRERAAHGGLEIVYGLPRTAPDSPPLRRKASEIAAQRIVDFIVERGLAAGAKLPSEAEMIEYYGVSRETLREALRLLEVQGFLSIRRGPGGGPTVESVNTGFLARTASLYFHLAGASYDEVFETWINIEPPIAARAAAHPDRDFVRSRLEPFLDEKQGIAPVVEDGVTRSLHSMIAELAGNRVMLMLTQVIGHIVTDQITSSLAPDRARELIAHDHRLIAEAVIKRHPRKAEELMASHILDVVTYYRENYPEHMGDPITWR